MKDTLTIIDSFVHNDKVEDKLNNRIDRLKERKHDILLISNTVIKSSVIEKVDFYFYDKRNQLFEDTYTNYATTIFWRQYGNFIVYDVVPGLQRHGLSVLVNLFNSVNFARTLGYEFFQRFEADDLMGQRSLDFVDQVPKLCENSKSLGLFYFNERQNEKERDVSFHYFYCHCFYFLEKVRRIRDEKDYLNFLLVHQKNKDFMIAERYIYENFKMNGSTRLLKRSGLTDITIDFPDTVWNTETTPSNVPAKYQGCITKLYKKRIRGESSDGLVIFSYNHVPVKKNRMIIVENENGIADTIHHNFTEANQWYFNIIPENINKIKVFESNVFLYEEVNKNIESYIDFL
jgi:hypothetical protein